jgi:rubrerythrin
MQPGTEIGMNHSGMQSAPEVAEKMLENTGLTEAGGGDETGIAKVRMEYAAAAEPVGSLPDPAKTGIEALLMDKLGERLAFERTGVRLYDALIAKCGANGKGGPSKEELEHIRAEEAQHFALIGKAIEAVGGDPTAQTPAADVMGIEGSGLLQVLTDPKTTVAQALHAILVAEMTDNVAWQELIEVAGDAGNEDLVEQFTKAQAQEAEHLESVRTWYRAATMAADYNVSRKQT